MFSKLKKLFDKTADSAVPPPAVSTPEAAPAPPFLRREAVFGRDNRIAGHLFSVQQSSILADATPEQIAEGVRRQREHIMLLDGADPLRGGVAD